MAATSVSAPRRRIAIVIGTRPEIIKLAPVIHEIDRRFGAGTALVINTGQHYDMSMSGQFWPELGLREPEVRLEAGGLSRAECIGYLTIELGRIFAGRRPVAVIVQGDTNSTVAGAIAANAEGIPLVHVEAGLRSFDRDMPEEHNRVVTDMLADLACAATLGNVNNLRSAGVPAERVMLTGNPIVEAVQRQLPSATDRLVTLRAYDLVPDRYILATFHRPENTDDPANLRTILESLVALTDRLPVLLPLHPRTRMRAEQAGCEDLLDKLGVVEPLGAKDFLSLAAHAAVLISDSGGLAEEVTVLKRPLVVVRRSTEREESIHAGFARLVRPYEIVGAVGDVLDEHDDLLDRLAKTASPYGDGTAAARISWAAFHLVEQRSASATRSRAGR